MILREWVDLPDEMRNESVKKYYDILKRKKVSLFMKRLFDLVFGLLFLVVFGPGLLIIGVLIKIDSKGPIMFRQVRVTQYGRQFRIFKFRTMVKAAEEIGAQITTKDDSRITKVGKVLRKYRIDEFPQILNIISGDMSFVGTRPEVPKYVERYSEEMRATLLLPAGVTSEASVEFKDEEEILTNADDVDKTYTEDVLPEKMKINLQSIEYFGFFSELKVLARTVWAMVK